MRVHSAFGLPGGPAGIQPERKLIGMGICMAIIGQRITVEQVIEAQPAMGCRRVVCIVCYARQHHGHLLPRLCHGVF
jgi:hypothetical protein